MSALFSGDVDGPSRPMPHFWEHTIGSGHATLALRADWQAQMRRAHDELGVRHVRFHGLLSDDVGTLIAEGDTLFYSFFNADQIFDFLKSIGMRPFVEFSFMPTALASGTQTVFHYSANVSPPKDYEKWATLIRKLVGHWVERYGLEEVRNWYFEVWNEPNLTAFGSGKQSDYFENTRRAINVQRCYGELNPHEFAGYDRNCWGLSACDGPTDERPDVNNERRRLFGYAARGVPYGPDDGTLSPPAVLASVAFAPELALSALRNMLLRCPEILDGDRLATSFNASLVDANGRPWVSPGQYGLDQGVIFMMIENHCSGGIWRTLRRCQPLVDGLRKAGFSGGWLDAPTAEAAA